MNLAKKYKSFVRYDDEEKCIDLLNKHPFLLEASIDDEKNTPFLLACDNAHHKVIDYLVEKGVNVHLSNALQQNAVSFAVLSKDILLMKKLYSLGLDFDQKDVYGYTPLLDACSFDRSDMIKFLIEKGVDVNVRIKKTSFVSLLKEEKIEVEFNFIMKHFDKFNEENQRILKGLQLKNLVSKGSIGYEK